MHASAFTSSARMNGLRTFLQFAYKRYMSDEWRERLVGKIEADGRSLRAISIAANLGPNYLSQMFERNTAPSTPALVALCAELNVSLTYIFTGASLSPDDEELLQLVARMPEPEKKAFLEYVRQTRGAAPR